MTLQIISLNRSYVLKSEMWLLALHVIGMYWGTFIKFLDLNLKIEPQEQYISYPKVPYHLSQMCHHRHMQ